MPLQPILAKNQSILAWLLYQFLYVAVAEEIFFRGYVQNNILNLLTAQNISQKPSRNWLSIILSASVFAVAHVIVLGRFISVVTFFPGLLLGWLFIRTKSLIAPILFHAMANVSYLAMAALLT
jgi:membrane protease YdiL (CAAX protease family)